MCGGLTNNRLAREVHDGACTTLARYGGFKNGKFELSDATIKKYLHLFVISPEGEQTASSSRTSKKQNRHQGTKV